MTLNQLLVRPASDGQGLPSGPPGAYTPDMSIKILNGVRLPPGLTLEGVFGWVASVRPQLAALASREWFEAQCREALTLYDRQTAGAAGIALSGPLIQGNPFSQARRRLLSDVSEAQKERLCSRCVLVFV